MLNSFSSELGSDLAHRVFDLIVCLLEFLLLVVDSFEVVVFCHNGWGRAIELSSEVRDCAFQMFDIGNGFFAPLSPQPCPQGSSLVLFPSVVF